MAEMITNEMTESDFKSLDYLVNMSIHYFLLVNIRAGMRSNKYNVPKITSFNEALPKNMNEDEREWLKDVLSDAKIYLQQTKNTGEVEYDGDNVITGRYTMSTAVVDMYLHSNEVKERALELIENKDKLLNWINFVGIKIRNVGRVDGKSKSKDPSTDTNEFFAQLYHAYLTQRIENAIDYFSVIHDEILCEYW